jgi:hypothetical protein
MVHHKEKRLPSPAHHALRHVAQRNDYCQAAGTGTGISFPEGSLKST